MDFARGPKFDFVNSVARRLKNPEYPAIMLPLCLPPDIAIRLDHLAAATGRTAGFRAFEKILRHICALEDIYIAEQRLADLRAGWSETIKLEDLMRQFRKAL